jgi:hypothetical protein
MENQSILDQTTLNTGIPVDDTVTIKDKHKGGRPRDCDRPIPTNINELLDIVVWSKIVRTIVREALGGYSYVNGNGQTLIALPNTDMLKFLVEQMFGKATTRDVADKDVKDIIKMFAAHTASVLPVKSGTTVNAAGKFN